jgi:hypothetical protein
MMSRPRSLTTPELGPGQSPMTSMKVIEAHFGPLRQFALGRSTGPVPTRSDPDGVFTFRWLKTQTGRVPALPRRRRCSHGR